MLDSSDYLPISVATLSPSTLSDFDLYQKEASVRGFALYRGSGYPVQDSDLNKLRMRGVKHLYIPKLQQGQYQCYLRELMDDESSETTPVSVRAGALGEVVRDLLETAFEKDDTDESVSVASMLGSQTADIVCNDEFASGDLFRVLHHDYATFTHSANVAMYAAMLAAEVGYDQSDVALIASGGLVHDLGKLDIDEKILCKPGRLTEAEFREVKKHPTVGFRLLAHREDLTNGQLMMVYQHHERVGGGGYPVGVSGDEIHPWAKICAIVDVFEALTSNRPYRKPMAKHLVLELLERESDGFDREFLECWKKITKAFWKD